MRPAPSSPSPLVTLNLARNAGELLRQRGALLGAVLGEFGQVDTLRLVGEGRDVSPLERRILQVPAHGKFEEALAWLRAWFEGIERGDGQVGAGVDCGAVRSHVMTTPSLRFALPIAAASCRRAP